MNTCFQQPRTRAMDTRAFAPSIHWVGHQVLPPTQGLPRRLYDSELMYVYSGRIAVAFEDSAEPVIFNSGDLLVIPPAIRHSVATLSEPHVRLLGIHFDLYDELDIERVNDMVVQERAVIDELFCFWPVTEEGGLVFPRCYRSVPLEIIGWMEEIAKSFQSGKLDTILICRGYMQLIIGTLLRLSHDQSQPGSSFAYEERLLELKADLQQNIHLPHTNKQMAQRLNVSEDYFCRIFKQVFDMSPQKYLQDLRHQAAKHYLRETDYKIEHIGALVGYSDLHNFSHIFKKWQGTSPLNYRKRFR